MTKERVATVSAAIGAGLLFATAGLHLSVYSAVVSQAPVDVQALLSALWVAGGASLIIAALLTPISIAAVQIAYLAFLPPTGLLLVDAVVLLVAGELGREYQPRPTSGL